MYPVAVVSERFSDRVGRLVRRAREAVVHAELERNRQRRFRDERGRDRRRGLCPARRASVEGCAVHENLRGERAIERRERHGRVESLEALDEIEWETATAGIELGEC